MGWLHSDKEPYVEGINETNGDVDTELTGADLKPQKPEVVRRMMMMMMMMSKGGGTDVTTYTKAHILCHWVLPERGLCM